MGRRLKQISTVARAARAMLALALLVLLVSGSVPFTSAAGEPKCELECCAALASHAAGSCGEGACHAGMLGDHADGSGSSQLADAPLTSAPLEPLCGLRTDFGANNLVRMRLSQSNESALSSSSGWSSEAPANSPPHTATDYSSDTDARARVSVAVVSRPCNPECSAGAVSSSNQSSKRKAVVAGDAHQHAPTASELLRTTHPQHQTLDALCGRCSPRGPPKSLLIIV